MYGGLPHQRLPVRVDMESILKNPDMEKYRRVFEPGQVIFWEGDDSSELNILVSGQLNVLKGDKVIAFMDEPGTIFGEMSFLLGGKRTATVKALGRVEVFSVPQEDIESLRQQYPHMTDEISRHLAERLDRASQVVYGLRQFSDQIPDAVVLTDQDCRVISMNKAARNLYGRDFSQLQGKHLADLYDDPDALKGFNEVVKSGKQVRERALPIMHPHKGRRWVSVSINSLFDARQNFKGLLALGRDVTASHRTKKSFQRTLLFLIPLLIGFGAYIILDAMDIQVLGPSTKQMALHKHELQTLLAKDFFMLKAQLLDHFDPADYKVTHAKLKKLAGIQDKSKVPYTAIILLDKNKRVFDAANIKGRVNAESMIGNTYAHLNFQGRPDSLHKVLSVYRRERGQASSYNVLEMAFEVKREGQTLGWIVFKMDMNMLKKVFKVGREGPEGVCVPGALKRLAGCRIKRAAPAGPPLMFMATPA
jgi:PAS domain S-box-containing protein